MWETLQATVCQVHCLKSPTSLDDVLESLISRPVFPVIVYTSLPHNGAPIHLH